MTSDSGEITSPEVHGLSGDRDAIVAREATLRILRERVEQAASGEGGVIALRGESGVGKSRLLAEIASEAAVEDWRVAVVAGRGSVHRPFQPISDLFRALLDVNAELPANVQRTRLEGTLAFLGLTTLREPVEQVLGLDEQDLGQTGQTPMEHATIPRMKAVSRDEADLLTHFKTVTDVARQSELAEVLLYLIQAIAERTSGVLIVLEDIDEASHTTQEIAEALLPNLETIKALLFVSFKPDADIDLREMYRGMSMDIDALSSHETLKLIEAYLGAPAVSDVTKDTLWAAAGGLPLLIRMSLDLLAEEGTLYRDSDTVMLDAEADIPSGRAIIGRMIRALPADQLKTLLYAVILGDGFRIGVLDHLFEAREHDELARDLEELVVAGILDRTGTGRAAVYRFRQTVTRNTIYDSAPDNHRVTLHKRAGAYYASMDGGSVRAESAVYHYMRAALPDRAMWVVDNALKNVRQEGDLNDRMRLYLLGLRTAKEDPLLAPRIVGMAEILGDTYAALGDYEGAARSYREGITDMTPDSLQGKAALTMLSLYPAQAANLLMRAATTIPQDAPHDLHWLVRAGMVWAFALTERGYEAMRRGRDALSDLGRLGGLGEIRSLVRGTLGMAMYYSDDKDEAIAHLESARGGYGARNNQDGVMFVNQVLLDVPKTEITRAWLKLVMNPIVKGVLPE